MSESISHEPLPSTNVAADTREFTAPLGGATSGRFTVTGGVSQLTLRADGAMPDLIRARFERPTPRVRVEGGAVDVHYPRPPLLSWLANWRDEPVFATLNATIPWQIALRGGLSKFTGDLAGLSLSGLTVDGGASEVSLTLGRPSGTVAIRINGGASNLSIRRPAGTPARLRVEGGAARLVFDTTQIGATGGPSRWESPGFAEATDRYEIVVAGGASRLTVEES
jgi:hypothetical protein